MSSVREYARDDSGTSMVEFALVAPVVILVLVASLDFARALNAYVTVANATREGARYASVHPEADPAAIVASVAARISPLDPGSLSVTATYDDGSGAQAWPVGGLPLSPRAPTAMRVRVSASYPWVASTWVVGSFFGATGTRTFGSSSTSEAFR
jgi:Flp pilus assembly protein TadG